MSLDQTVADAVYSTLVAEDATYIDASGAETEVRIIPPENPDLLLSGADIGVNGSQVVMRVRVLEIECPRKGDIIEYGSDRYRIDGYERLNRSEWSLQVIV